MLNKGWEMPLADYIVKYWAGAEVMYGVIIAMTFTSTLRGWGYPIFFDLILKKTIVAALACCMAWGIADGLFYLWERRYIIRQENRIIQISKSDQPDESAIPLIEEQLDDTILRNVPRETRQKLYQELARSLSTVHVREKISPHDTTTIIFGTFLRSAAAGIIIVTPFFVINNVGQARIVSNLAGIFLLFGVGYFRALDENFFSKVLFGLSSSLIGIAIASITIVLGG
jgi:VIT1/CCC1 family predicted Fe2+/Mn2+ transporter